MLYKEAVDHQLMVILRKLMDIDKLQNFSLVRGTALSLQRGHRRSADIDLFCPPVKSKDLLMIESEIKHKFPSASSFSGSSISIAFYINNIKVDFVYYPYENIRPVIVKDKIKMFSLPDIAAMKVKTIGNRGLKKDFYDIDELLNVYSLKEMFSFFEEKYRNPNYGHYLRSLTYFEDAEKSENPVMLNNRTWPKVKERVRKAAIDFFKQNL